MDLIQAALEPNTEVTAFQSKGGISTSCSLIERHGYIVLIQGFLLSMIPNCIFDKRRHLLQKKKVSLRNGIAFVVVVAVSIGVVNTFTEYCRNGLCCWCVFGYFQCLQQAVSRKHISKMIGSSPEEKDHPTLQWNAERIILVVHF